MDRANWVSISRINFIARLKFLLLWLKTWQKPTWGGKHIFHIQSRSIFLGVAPPTISWVLSYQSLIKKCSHRPDWWWQFSTEILSSYNFRANSRLSIWNPHICRSLKVIVFKGMVFKRQSVHKGRILMSRIMPSASSRWEHTQKIAMNKETGWHQTKISTNTFTYDFRNITNKLLISKSHSIYDMLL